MILNEYRTVAYNEWIKLPERFLNFELDTFQIMPNHMHGIIVLNDVRASLADAHQDDPDVHDVGLSLADTPLQQAKGKILSNNFQLHYKQSCKLE